MELLLSAVKVIVAMGIVYVWIVRFRQPTPWRGGDARNMPEEFAVYGLPPWFMWCVGALKISCALALLAGIWFVALSQLAAALLALLMVGAIAMHVKVKDPLRKSLPALVMLALALLIVLL